MTRLELDDVEDGCYFTADDLLTVVLTLHEAQADLADRMELLLRSDATWTLEEMSEIFDVSLLQVCQAFAQLSQEGAIFQVFTTSGDQRYKLIGWL